MTDISINNINDNINDNMTDISIYNNNDISINNNDISINNNNDNINDNMIDISIYNINDNMTDISIYNNNDISIYNNTDNINDNMIDNSIYNNNDNSIYNNDDNSIYNNNDNSIYNNDIINYTIDFNIYNISLDYIDIIFIEIIRDVISHDEEKNIINNYINKSYDEKTLVSLSKNVKENIISLYKKILYRYIHIEYILNSNKELIKNNINNISFAISVIIKKIIYEKKYNDSCYINCTDILFWENRILKYINYNVYKNLYVITENNNFITLSYINIYNYYKKTVNKINNKINLSNYNKIIAKNNKIIANNLNNEIDNNLNNKIDNNLNNKIDNNLNNEIDNNLNNEIDNNLNNEIDNNLNNEIDNNLNNEIDNNLNNEIIGFKNKKYKIIEFLSEGSYGIIYKIIDIQDNKIYVLKNFKVECKNTDYNILNEISFNLILDNINIYKIHDLTVINNKLNIIFPYYGISILELSIKLYFNKNNIKIILKQILEGINYLHKNNIIHGDLSSKNILINDKDNKITIIDFGLSKIHNINNIYNYNIYTVLYRAPEIILKNSYDHKIDIWAIGCLLGEMLNNNLLLYILKENDEENINTIFNFIGTPKIFNNNNNKIINIKNYPSSIKYFIDFYEDPNLSDLFIKLLEFDPKKRINAELALNHPYFINN
jgi:hypothetical protein